MPHQLQNGKAPRPTGAGQNQSGYRKSAAPTPGGGKGTVGGAPVKSRGQKADGNTYSPTPAKTKHGGKKNVGGMPC